MDHLAENGIIFVGHRTNNTVLLILILVHKQVTGVDKSGVSSMILKLVLLEDLISQEAVSFHIPVANQSNIIVTVYVDIPIVIETKKIGKRVSVLLG
jgi:hypothetical protein